MSALVVLQQMIIIFTLILVGYVLYKKNLIKGEASSSLSAIVVNVCNPALLISSSFDRDPAITNARILEAVLAGAIIYALLLCSAVIIPAVLHVEHKWKKHYAMMCIFGNSGFIGIPLIAAVIGQQALIYTAILNIYYTLFFYTLGYYLAGGEDRSFRVKNLLNLGNLSVILAIVFFLLEPEVPAMIQNGLKQMGNATTLLAMLVIGISLARSDLKTIFSDYKLYIFIGARFVLMPVLISLILRRVIEDPVLYGVMVILSAVPVGNMPLMRVEEIQGDGRLLSKGIILSTLLSVITVPLVTLFI